MNNKLIIIELLEPTKAPDLRYVTISSSDMNKSDWEFGDTAINILKSQKKHSDDAIFTVKQVIKFGDFDSYKTFFNSQITEYLEMEDNIEAQYKKDILVHLGNVITLEGQSLDTLVDSEEKRQLLNIQFKLLSIQEEIASQPEGKIELKKSGNLFITGFSENVRKLISDRIHSN